MKLKLLIIFLTILSNYIFANNFECISLGQTCTTEAALKAFNLRQVIQALLI
jgi:hypothetical protein